MRFLNSLSVTDIEEERNDDMRGKGFFKTSWDHPVLNDFRLAQSSRVHQDITDFDSLR